MERQALVVGLPHTKKEERRLAKEQLEAFHSTGVKTTGLLLGGSQNINKEPSKGIGGYWFTIYALTEVQRIDDGNNQAVCTVRFWRKSHVSQSHSLNKSVI